MKLLKRKKKEREHENKPRTNTPARKERPTLIQKSQETKDEPGCVQTEKYASRRPKNRTIHLGRPLRSSTPAASHIIPRFHSIAPAF